MAALVTKSLRRQNLKALSLLVTAATLGLAIIFSSLASAVQLGTRSITIGTSQPSVVTTHDFLFNTTTSGNIGSIELEYCTNSPFAGTPCTAPPGLDVSAANLDSQSGATSFVISPLTTPNKIVLTRSPALVNPSQLTYDFSNITNPSTLDQSVFVRISTFATNDTSGSLIDTGGVVFVITNGLGATAFVPPHLVLCVGAVVALDCSNQLDNIQDMGILTSKTTGSTTTQFSVGTNDPGGYSVFVFGNSMTSGNNVIQPAPLQQLSTKGFSQFGMNLVANSVPPVGTNPGGVGTGVVQSGYNLANFYKFTSGDLVARSIFSTDFTLFTASYIANIDKTQQPGIYTTTLTYVATAAF